MRKREATPDLYILDALADDVESVDTILGTLNSDTAIGWHRTWGRHFERGEVVQALSRLVKDGLVRVSVPSANGKWLEELSIGQLPPSNYDEAWFAITPRGRIVHSTWDPLLPSDEGG